MIKLTNIAKFLKNLRIIKSKDSDYIRKGFKDLVNSLKICKCIESFYHDDLLIEKGNIYLLRDKAVDYVVYEITGLWVNRGHEGGLLTHRATIEGLKGWNIPSYRGLAFKEINLNQLSTFLYWGTNEN